MSRCVTERGEEYHRVPSPPGADGAPLYQLLRLLATPERLPHSDEPKPAGGLSLSILSSISRESRLVRDDATLSGDLPNMSDPLEDEAESESASEPLRDGW